MGEDNRSMDDIKIQDLGPQKKVVEKHYKFLQLPLRAREFKSKVCIKSTFALLVVGLLFSLEACVGGQVLGSTGT